MAYEVKLDVFEGPLDLLLHLIKRLEIDIYDIPMAELTAQYVEHIETLAVLQLDELGEYLLLAATLIEIKSKTLLPVHEELEEATDELEEDPREQLVEKLLQYQLFKEAAYHLKERGVKEQQQFSKTPSIVEVEREEQQVQAKDLVLAFHRMLNRQKEKKPKQATIQRVEWSTEEAIATILKKLKGANGRCTFESLFETANRSQVVVTFFSLLHLLKEQKIQVKQSANFEQIEIFSLE